MLFSLLSVLLHVLRACLRSRSDLILENTALRQQVGVLKERNSRPRLEWSDRVFWAALRGAWDKWSEYVVVVKPETVIRWHREAFSRHWDRLSRAGRRGRPPIAQEIRDLIRRMVAENPTWRAPRIHGELRKLGFLVSERTVSRYLRRREPDPDKMQKWLSFLRNHRDGIAAMDFFTVPTATLRVLYVFFVIHHGRRQILHWNVTEHPCSAWVIQQLREAFPYDEAPKYLVLDRDSIFDECVLHAVKSFGTEHVRISYRSPWQNGVAERWVGSCRQEMLNHVIVLGEQHLRLLLRDYVAYYHEDRTHYTLGKDAPLHRRTTGKPSPEAQITALPRVGGLHHRYEWHEAA